MLTAGLERRRRRRRRHALSRPLPAAPLTICCALSSSAFVKSAPNTSAPVKSLRVRMARCTPGGAGGSGALVCYQACAVSPSH